MALMDGKMKPSSGGNAQRNAFSARVSGLSGGKARPESKTSMSREPEDGGDGSAGGSAGGSKTTITHNEDGSHTVMHHDGEQTEHPSMGHAAMAMAAKHDSGGEHGHIHNHGGMGMHEGSGPEHTVTTHHVGMDGEVQGPHHHENMDMAAEHLKGCMGGEGGMEGGSAGEEASEYA